MDTSLKAARDYVYNDRSWASTGKTLDKRVDTCLLRALRDLAGEVPEAMVPEAAHIHVHRAYTGSNEDVNATIKATADLKVLEFVIDASSTWTPEVDRTWDGIMHLFITDPDGRVRRRQGREWWSVTSGPTTTYFVSIDRPWFNTGSTEMDFTIYQPAWYLPANTIKVLTPLQLFDDSDQLIGQISSGTARRAQLPSKQLPTQYGRPAEFWRGEFFQLPSPTEAPRVSSIQAHTVDGGLNGGSTTFSLPWSGMMPPGKFEFCYTYAWGRNEQEWGETQGLFTDPVWESGPSPISEVFDHLTEHDKGVPKDTNPGGSSPASSATPTYTAARAIVIEMSNLEEMLDFVGDPLGVQADAATYPPTSVPLRYQRSGLRLRLYVRRTATYSDFGPDETFSETRATGNEFLIVDRNHRLSRVEADGKFYLLAELDPLDRNSILWDLALGGVGRVSTFVWQGAMQTVGSASAIVPDPTRQLIKSTGYYAYHLDTLPDQDYDIDVSILRQPKELVNDQDQVPIKQEAFPAFLELALAYMSRLDGVDQNAEMKHREMYKRHVRRFKSLHGDNQGVVENRPWSDFTPRYRYSTFSEG